MNSSNLITVFINNQEHKLPKGITIIQACELGNVDIPRFCYHERLSIAGNCRMCLVEIEQSPKLVASCAMNISPNIRIHTNTATVKKAREGILELLLANHPLDCPICDQGGECDLQDQAMVYGSDRGRYQEYKRAVEDKDCGPLIKTVMTRCIHCTRCIRFATEIAGVPVLGTTGRGNNMEVGTYINKLFISEVSGNIIDLCPVGALTSKPYAFTARPWELKSIETIDVLDPMCSNIRVDTRGSEIMRILPRLNESINEEWITDKTRFAFDGLKKQRITTPLIKQTSKLENVQLSFEKKTWEDCFHALKNVLDNVKQHSNGSNYNVTTILGKHVDLNSLYIFKKYKHLFNAILHEDIINENPEEFTTIDIKNEYTFSSSIQAIDQSDLCLLVGINLKNELPLLNARIRKAKISTVTLPVFNIGTPFDATYPIKNIGLTLNDFFKLLKGKHAACKHLLNAKRPLIIFGSDFAKYICNQTPLLNTFHHLLSRNLKKNGESAWSPFCFLNRSCSLIHAKEMGVQVNSINKFITSNLNQKNIFTLLILSEINNSTELLPYIQRLKQEKNQNLYIVFIGHHGCDIARMADMILPASAFTEKQSYYLNIEGRLQQTNVITRPPGDSRENWRIYKMLGLLLNSRSISTDEVYTTQTLHDNIYTEYGIGYPSIKGATAGFVQNTKQIQLETGYHSRVNTQHSALKNESYFSTKRLLINYTLQNFYLTDLITKNSKIMGQCSATFIDLKKTKWILS
jgi:NADH dehydrogenase (ubiquinone) Fe-S protein 1